MRIIGIITRCFVTRDKELLFTAFNSFVRPIIEYCSSVFSPYLKKDIEILERPLRKLTRLCSPPELSYAERLKYLDEPSMKDRRIACDLNLTYKIIHGISYLKFNHFLFVSII